MELVNTEQTALIVKEQIDRYGHHIWVIGPRGSAKQLAQLSGMDPANFHWLKKPEDLLDHHQPIVVIMPNWWQHGYPGMEDVLNQVEATIYNVYFGPKPNWKQPGRISGSSGQNPSLPEDSSRHKLE